MKALIDKTRLKFNGVITPELKTDLDKLGLIELQDRGGIFIYPQSISYSRLRQALKHNLVLLVTDIEDLYYTPGYHLLVNSEARPNLLALINSLEERIRTENNILQQATNLRLLAEMIDGYNYPVTLY